MDSWEDGSVCACAVIQCDLKELLMEAVSFEDYINRLKAQNIIIETGNSKKYGTVTKYRFSVEQRFHRGYSLGSFYTDDNIKKRISRRQDYLKTQKKKAEEKSGRTKRKAKSCLWCHVARWKKLDKSRLKISSMCDFSGDVSRDTVGLQKW